jgi:hypothetical protein
VSRERKPVLLRVDPAVHDALSRWAADEFRSVNADVEMLLRRALDDAGRMPQQEGPVPRRGRPSPAAPESGGATAAGTPTPPTGTRGSQTMGKPTSARE